MTKIKKAKARACPMLIADTLYYCLGHICAGQTQAHTYTYVYKKGDAGQHQGSKAVNY